MRTMGKNAMGVLALLLGACSHAPKTSGLADADSLNLGLVVLAPGHFHASLLQKNALYGVNDTVSVYAPEGSEVEQYLSDINSYNNRDEQPTAWKEQVYTGNDYLEKMLADKKGDIVMLAGNNQKKTTYINQAVKAGYHVLSDKPMAINKKDFELLSEAYKLAGQNGVVLYDLMTERYDILNIIEKELLNDKGVFGYLLPGTPQAPSVYMESVHHFYKEVTGKPLVRPAWYYDVKQQGEGIADVTTHLIDLVAWQCFPDTAIRYQTDVKVNDAKHWPTRISLVEYTRSTQMDSFPDYLKKDVKNDVLEVMANGTLSFSLFRTNIGIKVLWNYVAPPQGGDTFSSVKKGSKATLRILQNKGNNFVKQLYIQPEAHINEAEWEDLLGKCLKGKFPFANIVKEKDGRYLIDVPQANRLGHEDHFGKVASTFLHYVRHKDIPEWEKANTLAKYYITTTAVEMANRQK